MFGRNDFLGEVMLPMAGQMFDDPSSQWYSLQDRVNTTLNQGEGENGKSKETPVKRAFNLLQGVNQGH